MCGITRFASFFFFIAILVFESNAQEIEKRVFGSSGSIYERPSGFLDILYNTSGSIGSDYWWFGNGFNKARGVMEYKFGSYKPLPGTQVRLDLKNVGGANPPINNLHKVSWYAADGSVTVEDWGRSASQFTTLNFPAGQSPERIPVDITSVANSFAGSSSYIGFRFEPGSPSAFEDFGGSGNSNIGASLVVVDDAKEVLRNSIKKPVIKIETFPTGEIRIGIRAKFEPTCALGGCETELAKALGVEGFRWVQTVKTPKGWETYIANKSYNKKLSAQTLGAVLQLDVNNGTLVRFKIEKMFDPIAIAGNTVVLRNPDNGAFSLWQPNEPKYAIGVDGEDFYFTSADSGKVRDFFDFPIQSEKMFSKNEFLEFETSLVGLLNGGTDYMFWEGLKTNFSWKSDTTYTAPTVGLGFVGFSGSSEFASEGYEYAGGGIFDLNVDSGHEPGDANDDGVLNNLDIAWFVLALANPSAYQAMFPDVDPVQVLDMNQDGAFNNLDIADFVTALLGIG